ncbi:aldo/keto reductase [Rickenella mellea]|uniref:Aldo/keto reductase n=1 Tax=Rickenella mellea TaxID=50990 RepID=A0A4Y7QF87_9AGAM|nr:aldo/keto reductase [Rickenella mellea]
MTSQTTTIANGKVTLGKTGHGLMMMTWKPTPVPDDQAFDSIKASLDSVPEGAKMLINSGEFYGVNPRTANLELVARFFEKYPSYTDKAFLSVKGGTKRDSLEPDGSPENIRQSVDAVLAALRGTKKLDLFECARVDPNFPVEKVIGTLSELVKEGKFDYIGMSECSAESLRKGYKVHPIAAVEIEVSPFSYEEETRNVIVTAQELGVAVVAYSPLGRGVLTGQIKSAKDFEEGDFRRNLTRYKDENLKHNLTIVDALKAIAERHKVTPAQLSIAWVSSLGKHVIPIPGSSNRSRTLENIEGGNLQLTAEEVAEVYRVIAANPVKGDRYWGAGDKASGLWG